MRALLLVSVLLAVACGGDDDDDASGGPDAAPTEDECHEWRSRPETSWNSCSYDDESGAHAGTCTDVLMAPDGSLGCVILNPDMPGGCLWMTCVEVM